MANKLHLHVQPYNVYYIYMYVTEKRVTNGLYHRIYTALIEWVRRVGLPHAVLINSLTAVCLVYL